jgi:hypothetical protein
MLARGPLMIKHRLIEQMISIIKDALTQILVLNIICRSLPRESPNDLSIVRNA